MGAAQNGVCYETDRALNSPSMLPESQNVDLYHPHECKVVRVTTNTEYFAILLVLLYSYHHLLQAWERTVLELK